MILQNVGIIRRRSLSSYGKTVTVKQIARYVTGESADRESRAFTRV